jgi:hypothetical protein
MAIHFENYRTFSKGQGYIGVACRIISPQARSARWKAVDCPSCRESLKGRRVISRTGQTGTVMVARYGYMELKIEGYEDIQLIEVGAFDQDWAPFPALDEIFS